MPDPTPSDFVRLDQRVRSVEPVAAQMARVEAKVDNLGEALAKMMLLEERQLQHTDRQRDMQRQLDGYAGRMDVKVNALETNLQDLQRQFEGYKQRYLGITAAVSAIGAGAWALAQHFLHR